MAGLKKSGLRARTEMKLRRMSRFVPIKKRSSGQERKFRCELLP